MDSCCAAVGSQAVAESLWLVFIGGLAGSAHCLGMCGPLVAMVEGMRSGQGSVWSHLPLHMGRIVTYSILGVVAGLLGSAFERGGLVFGVRGAAALIGGSAMVAFAALMLGWIPLRWGATVGQRAADRIAAGLNSHRPMSGVVMGLYWGLLPCGLVWLFLARAAAAGSAVGGAAVMMVFGAGTVPALLVLGSVAGLIGARHRQVLSRCGAAFLLVMGVLLMLRGAAGAGWIAHFKIAPGLPLF